MSPSITNDDSLNGVETSINHDSPSTNNVKSSNSAFVLRKKGEFYHETRLMPPPPSDHLVTIEVHTTGLCGSDIHYWTHGEIGDFKVLKPLILGHESAGIVHQCGPAVKSLKPGDRVALEPGIPCRTCDYCQAGKYNLCSSVQFAATPPYDGTLAKFYALPESLCYKLPRQISLEEGALIEPLSVAVHCCKLAAIQFSSSVLVLGAGPIGLLCCAVARAFGATNVIAVDVVKARLDFAREYAATATYEMESLSPEENAQQLKSRTHLSEGAEVVIDATGAQPCIITGIHAMKKGGTFIQAGLGASNIEFPVGQLCSKEGIYRGSFRYGPGDYTTAIELVAQAKVSVKELITHSFPFEEAEQAFENVKQRRGIKTIIYAPGICGSPDTAA